MLAVAFARRKAVAVAAQLLLAPLAALATRSRSSQVLEFLIDLDIEASEV